MKKSGSGSAAPAMDSKSESGVVVAAALLKRHRGPMNVTKLARAVIASGRAAGLGGKTPEATVSAHIYVDAKRDDGVFVKVDRGMVDLRTRVGS